MSPRHTRTVAAVVLAAGAGSRYDADHHKLLAGFRGKPLVRWAVDAAVEGGLDEVIVVTGAVDLGGVLPAGVTVVHNERWADGQATSLAAGIDAADAAGHAAAVVGLADQPLVPADAWRVVGRAEGGPIVVATYDGQPRNPVRLDREVWPLLPREGDEGARALVRGRPDLVTRVACSGDPADVDTREDLSRWS